MEWAESCVVLGDVFTCLSLSVGFMVSDKTTEVYMYMYGIYMYVHVHTIAPHILHVTACANPTLGVTLMYMYSCRYMYMYVYT